MRIKKFLLFTFKLYAIGAMLFLPVFILSVTNDSIAKFILTSTHYLHEVLRSN